MMNKKNFTIIIAVICLLTTIGIFPKAEDNIRIELANITANVDNVSPSPNTIVNVNVTGPAKAEVKLVCHYKTGDVSYSGVIGNAGNAMIPVQVESNSSGYSVVVDVSVIADKTYTVQTLFIPK